MCVKPQTVQGVLDEIESGV